MLYPRPHQNNIMNRFYERYEIILTLTQSQVDFATLEFQRYALFKFILLLIYYNTSDNIFIQLATEIQI